MAAGNTTATTAIQAELDATQTGVGLNANGTYSANTTANYINTATSLVNATEVLDTQVKTNADAIATNATASTTADATLQSNINTLTATVASNATTAATATALKEDATNKSIDGTFASNSDIKFPTEKAVKTYVDAQVTTGTATNVSGIVAIANGGTGSSIQNFVDITTAQTIAGNKTFSSNINVSGLTIGGTSNATLLGANVTGSAYSTTIGNNASSPNSYSVAIGRNSNAMSSYSLAIGGLSAKADGAYSLAIGGNTPEATGVYSTAIGGSLPKASALQSTALGSSTTASGQNSTALGYGATVTNANTIQLGNTSITDVKTSGTLTAGSVTYPKTHGTNGQVLSTTGSGILSWTTPSTTANSYSGVLPVVNGGTGSSIQNFVDLTTNQTIAGEKIFSGLTTIDSNLVTSGTTVFGDLTAFSGTFANRATLDIVSDSGGDLITGYVNGSSGDRFNVKINSTLSQAEIKSGGGYGLTFFSESGTMFFEGNSFMSTPTFDFNGDILGSSFVKVGGSSSQFLKADGSVDSSTYLTSSGTATNVSGIVAVANGGTGSATQNFVDITTDQTIAGNKTFTGTPTAPTATAGTNTTQIATTAFVTAANNGLVKITENSLTGYRWANANAANYGDIGNSAVDLSVSTETSDTNGATGSYAVAMGKSTTASGGTSTSMGSYTTASGSFSTAMGAYTTASGMFSTAMGQGTEASGEFSTGMGLFTKASDFASTVIGQYNSTGNTATSATAFSLSNPAFVIGNGTSDVELSDAFSVDFSGNVIAKGTIKAGAVTYPKLDGSAGQVLATDGSGTLAWSTPSTTATSYSGVLPVANGGTGSATQNFVDLTTNQTVAGTKTFSSDLLVNGVAIGKGAGSVSSNTGAGVSSLGLNTTGSHNTSFGLYSLHDNLVGSRNVAIGSNTLYKNLSYDNTAVGYLSLQNNSSGDHNVGIGSEALKANTAGNYNSGVGFQSLWSNTSGVNNSAMGGYSLLTNSTGSNNTAFGNKSLQKNTTANQNTAIGSQAMQNNTTGASNATVGIGTIDFNTTGSNNAAIGAFAGRYIANNTTNATVINNSVLIGANTKPLADNGTNEIVIGYNAIGNGSNTVQLGNTSVTNVKTSGTVTAGAVTYTKTDGANGQVLMTNGYGVTSWGSPAASVIEKADEFSATASQTSFTLTTTPSANSKVKMYVNGIRVSNTAYSWSGNTLTYVPANNGGYSLSVSDRIQFDYFY